MMSLSSRCIRQRAHIFTRCQSSLTFANKQAEFADRRKLIKENHKAFYPVLKDTRFSGPTPSRIPEFRKKFKRFNWPESKRIDELHIVEGKIDSIRKSGKGMIFIDLIQDFEKIQLVIMNKLMGLSKDELAGTHDLLKAGDFITAIGYPGVTNVGELSLKCTEPVRLACPTLHPLPPKLVDSNKRHYNRVVDYLVNERSQKIIFARSLIIASLRNFLNQKGFIEVSTPIIASQTKGANATPFVTSSKHVKDSNGNPIELQLRVAPELWLKKLIIGGFDKVYEIGSSFRNEGVDGTHNPEFTTCELYQTFIGLEDLMNLSESFFLHIFKEVNIDITRPQIEYLKSIMQGESFDRIEFIPTIEKITCVRLPAELTADSLLAYFKKIDLAPPKVTSVPQLLDKLSSHYLEPLCKGPTFIYHQPAIMAPLAKSAMVAYGDRSFEVSRRFELFIDGSEYINAYEEENNPYDQELKFRQQQELKNDFNDEESIVPDHRYLKTMEWGMPPTGGWGIGIDRFVGLLVGEKRIEEVLTFGTITDVIKQ